MEPKRKYIYNGPVLLFDTLIANHWRGETMAETAKKAKSNLVYQYKKQNGLSVTAKISLPNEVLVEETWREKIS